MSELSKLLIASLIKQRLAEPERERLRDERAAEIAAARDQELISSVVQKGGKGKDLYSIQGMLENTPAHRLDAWATIADLNAKAAKEEKDRAEAMGPEGLANLASVGSATPDVSGLLRPPTPDAQNAYQAGLQNRARMLTDPRDVTSLVQQVEQFKAQNEAAQREKIAGERRQVGITAEGERRRESLAAETAVVDSQATEVAYAAYGLADPIPGVSLSDVPGSTAALSARMQEAGVAPGVANRRAKEAMGKARGMFAELKKWEKDVNGKGLDFTRIEARVRQLNDTYEQPTVLDKRTQDYLVLEATGRAIEDPVGVVEGHLGWIPVNSAKDADRQRAKRNDLVDLMDKSTQLSETYAATVEAQRSGRMAGGPGTFGGLYDLASFAGENVSEVQAYRATVFTYASSLLKAVQGGRFSDKDLAMQLLTFPTVAEIGTPNAEAKLAAMKRNLEMQKLAPYSPKVRAQMNAQQNAKTPPFSREMQMLLGEIRSGVVSINDPSVQSRFLQEADRWAAGQGASRALTFQNQSLGGRVDPEDDARLDKLLGGP